MKKRHYILELPATDAGGSAGQDRLGGEEATERWWLLLARVDPEQFFYFFDKYYARIIRFLYWRTLNPEVAEDLTGETFLRAQDNLWKFRWQRSPFKVWLHRIAYNVLMEHLRKEGRLPRAPEARLRRQSSQRLTPLEQIILEEDQEAIFRCLDELGEKSRNIIVMHYWNDLKVKEIASILRMRKGTVQSRLSRAYARLREIMTEHKISPPSRQS